MLQTLKNAWKTKELRSKILFTLFILLLYRIGTVIPVPFVEANNFANSFSGTILDQMNILSGGSLGTATLFALGVSPYINASIIIQLLAVVFPKLGELAKNDKEKMNFITRITTVILSIVTSVGYYFLLKNNGALTNAATSTDNGGAWFYGIVIVACYVAGASVIMWLGERINEKGIGNGISMILFANIVSSIPSFFYNLISLVVSTYQYEENVALYAILSTVFALVLIAAIVVMFMFVIWVTGSERRIPIQYAKRVVGRKMYGGQSSNLPIKLNMTGVMPVIFASSIVSLVPTILALCNVKETDEGFWGGCARVLAADGVIYPVLLFVLIIATGRHYPRYQTGQTHCTLYQEDSRQGYSCRRTLPWYRCGSPRCCRSSHPSAHHCLDIRRISQRSRCGSGNRGRNELVLGLHPPDDRSAGIQPHEHLYLRWYDPSYYSRRCSRDVQRA